MHSTPALFVNAGTCTKASMCANIDDESKSHGLELLELTAAATSLYTFFQCSPASMDSFSLSMTCHNLDQRNEPYSRRRHLSPLGHRAKIQQ